MTKYFGVEPDSQKVIPLGDHENFDGACGKMDEEHPGFNWIFDEASLRELQANINKVLTN